MFNIFLSDISIYSGDTRTIDVSVVDKSGIPVDISGSSIKWALIQNNTTIVTKDNSTIGGVIITSNFGGEFSVYVLAADTNNLSGSYDHEARLTDAGGNSSIVFEGTMTVTKSYI